jgi:o-succinylbenzoate---CoA ligase
MLTLCEIAQRTPTQAALICSDGVISFAKLFDKSEEIANQLGLSHNGSRPLAFVAHSELATIALIHALLDRRIPILPLHPRLTESEQRYLIDCAGARWLKWAQGAGPRASAALGSLFDASGADRCDAATLWRERTQLLIATSGSAGNPKLVRLTRRSLEAAADASSAHLRMTSNDRWLLSLSLAHVGGFSILVRCLSARAAVVLTEPGIAPAELAQLIDASAATLASFVPTQLERLLAEVSRPLRSKLRAVLVGGASAPPGILARARQLGIPALATYGLSEACAQVTTQPLSDLERSAVFDDAGTALPGVEIQVRNGIICIRSETLLDGYLPDAGPVLDANGWFATADSGRIVDGRLVALGRTDDCVVTGGEKIPPLEVERALLSLPNVQQAAVIALPDAHWGQVVAAALVLDPTVAWPDCLQTIQRELALDLARFKHPKRWLRLGEMPLLPNGKVDRCAIRAEFSRNAGVYA